MGSLGTEGAQLDLADCDSLLPPRKRLLAGLKRQNSDCSMLASVNSDELRARLQGLLNSSYLSAEEIVEAAKAEASAATKAAANAKTVAMEKAIVAANARTLAKALLELVAVSAERDENPMKSHPKKKRTRKDYETNEKDGNSKNTHPKKKSQKHVPVEQFYRSGGPVRISTTDEELARKLHRAMNSSPRITTRLCIKPEAVNSTGNSDGRALVNGTPAFPVDNILATEQENREGELGEKTSERTLADDPDIAMEAGESLEKPESMGKCVPHVRRGNKRRKKLPLSQCCQRAHEYDNAREVVPSENQPPIRDRKHGAVGDVPSHSGRVAKEECHASEEKPAWKCKKFRVSRCHSSGQNFHSPCSLPTLETVAALVKVD